MPQPNIILITTDQQRFDTIAALGNREIFTPHLDWLTRIGISYRNAYSDCPVCGPARATLMTGKHGYSLGHTSNNSLVSPMATMPSLPGELTKAGYQTRGIGKMHFQPVRANYGFEHLEILPDYYRWIKRQPGAPLPKMHGIGENEMQPTFSTCHESQTATAWTVDRGIDFLETRDPTRPYFLYLGFGKPHPPLDPPRSFWDIYDGIPMPDPWHGDYEVPAGYRVPTVMLNHVDQFTPAQSRNIRRAYYACISHIDYSLGRLFGRLRELGMQDNTLVVFTSDHGEMLGDHGLGAKSVFFEGSAHVPLIVARLGGSLDADAGRSDDRLACLADIMPTLLNAAGANLPEMDGLDLLGDVRRDSLVGESGPYFAAIADGAKAMWCQRGDASLAFDLESDPTESHALPAGDAKGAQATAVLEEFIAARGVVAEPAPDLSRVAPWPGLHTVDDELCDLLH